jgi:hypothetical protein
VDAPSASGAPFGNSALLADLAGALGVIACEGDLEEGTA